VSGLALLAKRCSYADCHPANKGSTGVELHPKLTH
jgi:hypothetical protein